MAIQHDTYLDTCGGQLYYSGASLRVREKDGQYILTMKTSVEATHVRVEDEAFLTEDEAADALGGRLSDVDCDIARSAVAYTGTADLRPVLLASNQRETWTIASTQESLKMCFDWVHYSDAADESASAVAEDYELEVELPGGPRSLVNEAALYLSRRYGLAPQLCSKYERGASLIGAFGCETFAPAAEPSLEPALAAA
ncbi:MAG: CYTH domain-containing protein [Candidatus Poribacteria bacterium]